ncbi:hypothetical protein ACJX0J_006433, partial [Zea mays]
YVINYLIIGTGSGASGYISKSKHYLIKNLAERTKSSFINFSSTKLVGVKNVSMVASTQYQNNLKCLYLVLNRFHTIYLQYINIKVNISWLITPTYVY